MNPHRSDTRAATAVHALTALLGAAAVVVQLVLVLRGGEVLVPDGGRVAGVGEEVVRFFSYFTIQSNLLVVVTTATLALRPDRDGRWWRVLRLDAMVGITVTGVVYATVLAPLVTLTGAAAATNVVFHYLIPVLAVIGWALFGPRPRISGSVLGWSLAWPVLYMGWIAVLGAITDWYPYPFIDVVDLGYGRVLLNAVGVVALILMVGLLYRWADHRLPARP